jgi:hypothetical protein
MVSLDPKDEVVLLHDHYRDTFGQIREREQRRDRLFVILLLMFVLLVFQTIYPATVGDSVGKISIAGLEIRPRDLPLPALLDVTWVLTLLTGLKYCQTTLADTRTSTGSRRRSESNCETRSSSPERASRI